MNSLTNVLFIPITYQNYLSVSGNGSDIREIKTLMEVYWLLCAAVKQTNTFYSCQLLVAIFTSFIHLLITWYYLIINMLPIVQQDSVPYLVMLFLWAIFHTAQLMFLVWPSTEITEAVSIDCIFFSWIEISCFN